MASCRNPDDSVAGSYEAPEKAGADNSKPSVLRYSGDPTSNLVGATTTKHNAEIPRGEKGTTRWPAAVTKSDPVNLTPPARDEALKHGKWDHSDA